MQNYHYNRFFVACTLNSFVLTTFIFCTFFLVPSFATAQPKNLNKDEQKFVAKWVNGMEMGGSELLIKANKTYTLTDDHSGQVESKGTWTAEKGVLVLTSDKKEKKIYTYTEKTNIEGKNNIGLKGKKCDVYKGVCFFKSKS